MASAAATAVSVPPPPPAVAEAFRLARLADEAATAADPARHVESLRSFLLYAETHRADLEEAAGEVAARLESAARVFYRLSEPDLALRAAEVGLALVPDAPSLLHRKALVLLARNRSLDEVLPFVERAIAQNPHDKALWATKGDALRLLDRRAEAAEAYLRAQQLDASSTQYVEKALKVVPDHPGALRTKLALAKAHGGDRQALQACETLLAESPQDPELQFHRAELLAGLGEPEKALQALEPLRGGSESARVSVLAARLLFLLDRSPEALEACRRVVTAEGPLDTPSLAELADWVARPGRDPVLARALRQKIRALEPRNLANLQSLRGLALSENRLDIAIDATRGILEASPDNLDGMRSLAELRLAAGEIGPAFEEYRSIARSHPHEVGELRKALVAAQTVGRQDAVLEFSEAILREAPEDVVAREELARAKVALHRPEEALAEYDRLLETRPEEVRYLLEKKRLLVELRRAEALPAVYDELFRLDPTRSDVALERGNLHLSHAYEQAEGSAERERAARTALVSYERASRDAQVRSESLLGIARSSRLLHDLERAVAAYRDFLAIDGHEARNDVRKELGHALRELNRPSEAEAAYAQAIGAGAEEVDLLWGEVDVLTALNRDAAALRYLDLLLEREPTNPLFLRRKGQLLLKTGRRAEALQVLKAAVSGAQGDPYAHFEVAEALRSQGAYADALAYYAQGLRLDPKSRPGRLALAETLLLAGRFDEAVAPLDALLHEDPNDLRAWKARADAFRALGRIPEVLYSLQAILLLDPHNGPALLERHRLHLAQGQKAEAYESLDRLLNGGGPESEDSALWLAHADLAGELGRAEDSNRSYERAQKLDPGQRPEILARRARTRLAAGRPDLALELLASVSADELPPDRAVAALLLRAEILTALERPAEAQTAYEEAHRRDPASTVALAGIARARLDQSQPAEARDLLERAIAEAPPDERLFLLLAEAEAGLGTLPKAVEVIQGGLQTLPRAAPLWVRLGELFVRLERWEEAANAYAHAIALDRRNAELHLRAGFVAEKLGHPNDALALYDQATQIAPSNKFAWNAQGLVLLALHRPEEGEASFDRALSLDTDFEAAKDGKRAALQQTRDGRIEKFGRDALLLEAKLNRTVTKNDLFVTLHIPFDLLEPVLQAISRTPKIDLARLSEGELRDLETASCQLVTSALERRPEGIERRGLTLADVAALAPPTFGLAPLQRLFGYVKAVLEAEIRPENLALAPDVEELARKALLLPEEQRTLFRLVRTLRVGLLKARIIKAVESAGRTAHAPLPSVDLGAFTPEFRADEDDAGDSGSESDDGRSVRPGLSVAEDASAFWPVDDETDASITIVPPSREARARRPPTPSGPPSARCAGCGGLASILHECGTPICPHCVAQFRTCPKCQQPVTPATSVGIGPGSSHVAGGNRTVHAAAEHAGHAPHARGREPDAAGPGSLRAMLGHSRTSGETHRPRGPKDATPEPPARGRSPANAPEPAPSSVAARSASVRGEAAAAAAVASAASVRRTSPAVPVPAAPSVAAAPSVVSETAAVPRPRERKDDEPRL